MALTITPTFEIIHKRNNIYLYIISWFGTGDGTGGAVSGSHPIQCNNKNEFFIFKHMSAYQDNDATLSSLLEIDSSHWEAIKTTSRTFPLMCVENGDWINYAASQYHIPPERIYNFQDGLYLGRPLVQAPTVIWRVNTNVNTKNYLCSAVFELIRGS